MNPLETEILKYEKKGFEVVQKKTLKYGKRVFLKKKQEGFLEFGFEGVYIYFLEGDATSESIRDCLKDYLKFYEAEEFGEGDKGFLLVSGSVDEKLFKDLRKALIRDDGKIRNSIKCVSLGESPKKDIEKEVEIAQSKKGEMKISDKASSVSEEKKTKKRVQLTAKERVYVWEHPEKYGRTCNICRDKIVKLSDLELDHTKPYSKGGTRMALAHRDCNKMKGSKNLRHVQTKMGFRKPKT